MREPTNQEIEDTRKHCIRRVVETMLTESMLGESGTVINSATVTARLEREFVGFQYSIKGGDADFRTFIDDSLPPDTLAPTATVGVLAVVEPTDAVAPLDFPCDPEPDPIDADSIRDAIHQGELRRGEVRSELFSAQGSRTIARQILASALQSFVSGRPVMTRTQVAQNFCQAAAADREAAKATGADRIPPAALHARSRLDFSLAYSSGGNADDHLRSRFRTGHRRGAVSQAVASDLNQRRALATAAVAVFKK
jgi:hypothetical protein